MEFKTAVVIVFLSCLSCSVGYDYKTVLRKSLLFYEAQRSGKLPADQKVKWRADSALKDKGWKGEDLTGGYYDAGDYVKFGFPMAFTTTVLSWSVLDHEKAYTKAGVLGDSHKAIKWATDYLLKCHVGENQLYGQVGLGQLDHVYWTRPEDMTMERPAFMINASAPGTDLAGETAAAMAAASLVFKTVNATYSATLLKHARQLFDFAYKYRGKYSDVIADANTFYPSSNYPDELAWGAAWMYRATREQKYMNVVNEIYPTIQYWDGFSWDDKKGGLDLLLATLTGESKYLDKLKTFCDYAFNKQTRTPKGLIFYSESASLRSTNNMLIICLEAAERGINANTYRKESKKQIDYMLGDSGFSYVVGIGNKYPKHAHHRSSSCPDHPAACGWTFFNSDVPNHHMVEGAIVGGPGSNDSYIDTRKDAPHNEVACDFNASFQACIAILVELGY
uniref:Endoglucanase n=1 Tax=Extatosoma tiaratum TaxID=7024 RepID=A0A125SKY2_EXTTI|nr:glycoside hydrolase family 9 [Extatosoma tiaratum]